ncbi:sigma factor [Kribbella sp. NPDC048915]|uniref:sigma factor n=1 Tax=Kribbella sp. NPDC048915 TaxID=3155148 RepID=UPI0033D682EE
MPADPPDTPTADADIEVAIEVFLAERSRLIRIARRILRNPESAEDVVQETWLRWQRTDRNAVRNPAAFLATTTTRLALNVVQSAPCRREAPTDPALVTVMDAADPTRPAEQTTAVEETLYLLMRRLRPAELAAYLLRKGFDRPYGDIAVLLHTNAVNARQLVRRAQEHLGGDRVREFSPDAHRDLVVAFLAAAREGDFTDLDQLLLGALRHPRPAELRVA